MHVLLFVVLINATTAGTEILSYVDTDPYTTLDPNIYMPVTPEVVASWRSGRVDYTAQQLFVLPTEIGGMKLTAVLVGTMGDASKWTTDSFTVSLLLPHGGQLQGKAGGHARCNKYGIALTNGINYTPVPNERVNIQVHPAGGFENFSPYLAVEKDKNLAGSTGRGNASTIIYWDSNQSDNVNLNIGDIALHLVFGDMIESIKPMTSDFNRLDYIISPQLQFNLPFGNGEIIIINPLGQIVARSSFKNRIDGNFMNNLPSGNYFYNFQNENTLQQGKIKVIK